MQVFLPHPSFTLSLGQLDNRRLANQINRECKTLINGGWSNHPVSKMWADYKPILAEYAVIGCQWLAHRKMRNLPSLRFFIQFIDNHHKSPFKFPPFIGDEEFHASHRRALLRKGIEDKAFELWKNRTTHLNVLLPTSKRRWTCREFLHVERLLGPIDVRDTWYGQWNWVEQPAEYENNTIPYVWPVPVKSS